MLTTTYLLNEEIWAKSLFKKFCLCCGEPVGTNILGSTCAWWQKTTKRRTYTHTHTHIHMTTTAALTTHACGGLSTEKR